MVIEIYGPSGIGKTRYALSLINNDEVVLYINADRQIQKNFTKPNMFILQENNINSINDKIDILLENLDYVILDSLPTINDGSNNLNVNTNKIITGIQKLISKCNRNKCNLIIINQERTGKEGSYTYGYNRLKLYYTKRIKITNDGYEITKDKTRGRLK